MVTMVCCLHLKYLVQKYTVEKTFEARVVNHERIVRGYVVCYPHVGTHPLLRGSTWKMEYAWCLFSRFDLWRRKRATSQLTLGWETLNSVQGILPNGFRLFTEASWHITSMVEPVARLWHPLMIEWPQKSVLWPAL